MKLTIALFFALSGLGCRDQVNRLNPPPVKPGHAEAAYVRDPRNGCKFVHKYTAFLEWDYAKHEPVINPGRSTYNCKGIYVLINNNEEQP